MLQKLSHLFFLTLALFLVNAYIAIPANFLPIAQPYTLKGSKGSFNMTETLTCISKNIVYGIICKPIHIIYTRETGRRLAVRITEHIRSIRKKKSGFPVAHHLNPPSHHSLNDFSVTGIIHCNCSNENGPNIENNIIF